ncbi:MAG TPA: helix-turn-helix domain-containing protein [Polyangiaceae bacterium LLY-WYZ-15_(1-7)]|nr:helix-turn-helix domain-containing protein [Polyangiaceae bacterium LLY-WYZ-15_(1-7)]HJL02699.1 helix-turn-helix domain-containing protein [Polyangiaceae bacterium LLY-WYZ-15_(1-7)]HJL12689.1 helix-turn-helix domain-containing protein [Polyangiaceae bacterium LLY-WYZ-15_(1-7)]HJL27092.1 helix-turn-helix domain-containing protein [Polyangiaceae bacterium LLY-WYZ-15_(1-7)]HJL29407.1 helix-turn-helix domain-containing protein [Polyangiaceae bacterium LLY-WYZ-15_(1-7)]
MAEEVEERVVAAMRQLGFNATDAKAYLALLKQHPATGYELATRSGVPRSAIYNVLKRLQGLGLINAVNEKPARYVPLPPQKLFQLLETRFGRNLESLKEGLEALNEEPNGSVTWTVEGYEAMLEQAEQLVGKAKQRVVASLWGREAEQLQKAFEEAVERGVEVVLFSFTPLPDEVGTQFSYGIEPADLEEHWEHRIVLLVDKQNLLVGRAEETSDNRAVVTDEVSLIEMAISNLVLDLTLFGERLKVDVSHVVESLTGWLAPVEALLEKSRK